MEDKIIKQFKTSCPFPLLQYKVLITYNEVKKASGVAYILLDLISKENKSRDYISDVLLSFGIPLDLHIIFGRELLQLARNGIIQTSLNYEWFEVLNYFKEVKFSDVSMTEKGLKMFKEGAIPTGTEKGKAKEVFYSPVTRRFDITCKSTFGELAKCYLGENFLDKVEIDVSGIEDYVNANRTLFSIKKEEIITSVKLDEGVTKKLHTRKEEGMTVIIKGNGVEFKFETSDENYFFNKYYSSELMTNGFLVKDKYAFRDTNKNLVSLPIIHLLDLADVSNLFIPADASKQAACPARFYLSRNKLGLSGNASAIKFDVNESKAVLTQIDANAEFALIDKGSIRYYIPYNVSMPCANFGGNFELQLLVERIADEKMSLNIFNSLFEIYLKREFLPENSKPMLFIIESLNEPTYFQKYIDAICFKTKSIDEKIDYVLRVNSSFKGNNLWKAFFNEFGKQLLLDSAQDIRLNNMIYKNQVLSPLRKELGISGLDYIKIFANSVINEDKNLLFEALESAGFDNELILSVINIVEIYLNKIINNENIESDSMFSDSFKTLSYNLWKLNNMLGITDNVSYALKDDYNYDEFQNSYATLIPAFEKTSKYLKYYVEGFAEIKKYIEIYKPIHELISIENEASSHPDNINQKYIDSLLTKGKYKNAICDLYVKLQYDLRKLLSDHTSEPYILINNAFEKELIDKEQCHELHQIRMIRNGFQHPEKEQKSFTVDDITKWKKIIFDIGDKKHEQNS